MSNDVTERDREVFAAGMRPYAWWKDGTQYVGTSGRTLIEAIARARDGAHDDEIGTVLDMMHDDEEAELERDLYVMRLGFLLGITSLRGALLENYPHESDNNRLLIDSETEIFAVEIQGKRHDDAMATFLRERRKAAAEAEAGEG